jgi:hypothetical protein
MSENTVEMGSMKTENTLRILAHFMREGHDRVAVQIMPSFLEDAANELETLRTEVRALKFALERYQPDREYINE